MAKVSKARTATSLGKHLHRYLTCVKEMLQQLGLHPRIEFAALLAFWATTPARQLYETHLLSVIHMIACIAKLETAILHVPNPSIFDE